MPLAPGTRIASYEITSAIGAGGMGEVYRARDTRLKRDIALKILPPAVASDDNRIARFQREAELLAALNHPNIAQIHGVEEASGSLVLVMELVDGEDLAARIARGPIAIDEALPIARQLAGALEAAHERGIIHRDLKPANIKLRPDGTVKVLDFGLAKAFDTGSGTAEPSAGNALANSPTITSPAMTAAGIVLGTVAYMSPEQARGKVVDKRADIWAFGAVVFEMLAGRRAFAGVDASETIASVLAREPDWSQLPAGLSATLQQYLKRCLDKDQMRRVRDIGDVLLAIDGAFDPQTSTVASAAPALPLWRRAMPIAAAALIAAAATGLVLWPRHPKVAPAAVSRFEVVLPPSQEMRNAQRSSIAVARDGRAFAYRAMDGIHLRSIDDVAPRLIPGTTEGARSAVSVVLGSPFTAPFFSPDGQWIGYFEDAGLKKIGIAGGSPVTIVASSASAVSYGLMSFGASWSADNTILFGQPAGIMRVSADGGTPELIVTAAEGEELWLPQLLPGSDAVLFTVVVAGSGLSSASRSAGAEGDAVVHTLSSGKRSVVVSGATDARYTAAGYLLYGLRRALMAIAFDARRLTTIGTAVPIAENVRRPSGISAGGVHYGVSDNGTLVYLTGGTPSRSLRWVNRDGSSLAVDAVPAGAIEEPRLSADGKRVLVTRDGDIWIYDLESGRSSRLTKDGRSLMGAWDPTGTRVAYSSMDGRVIDAWVAPADGSGAPQQLTHDGGLVHVDSWSPDGRTISVHRHAGPSTILMIPVDRPDDSLAFAELMSEGVSFARDGTHVAYSSADSGSREIYIRPYPGPGGRATVSVNGGVEPQWARTGEVFYRNAAGDRMFGVTTSTMPTLNVGKPTLVFQGSYYVAPTGSPRPQYDVTADGKRFLMITSSANDSGAHFVVVQNWLDGLKRRR